MQAVLDSIHIDTETALRLVYQRAVTSRNRCVTT